MTACRPVPGSGVQAIYAFEVMSSTEWSTPIAEPFIPNHYVDISNQLHTKLDALRVYQLEMRESPHTRSIDHIECLSRHRGFSIGVMAAESFVTLRTIR